MTAPIAAIVVLALAAIAALATSVALAIRQAGLRERLGDFRTELALAMRTNSDLSHELDRERDAHRAHASVLTREIERLRKGIDAIPDSPAGRDVLRGELDRLLSAASPVARSVDTDKLP